MTPLYVIMHGLIALMPHNKPAESNLMTALLVNAMKQPAEMTECFEEHVPVLTVKPEPGSGTQCNAAGCHFDGTFCTCDFSPPPTPPIPPRRQARLEIINAPPLPLPAPLNRRLAASLPFDYNFASDFSYIPNLTQAPLNARLDKRSLDESTDAEQIVPDSLIARMTFPYTNVYACTLGERPDEGSNNVYPFAFRPLHAAEAPGELKQAAAQQALAFINVPDGAKVVLTISELSGANSHSINLATTINPQNNRSEYLIQLTNSRKMHLDRPDEPCDDGVGRDFAFFYSLAEGAAPWGNRQIPHIKYANWKSSRDILVDECVLHQHLAMTSRPICAMATFDEPE